MRVLDLCCGAGGFSYGFQQAGFKIVLGVDIDPKVGPTFETNHQAEFLCQDILTLDPSTLGRFDVVIGSPPCDELSTMNPKHDVNEGLVLVRRFLEIVNAIQPRYWLGENTSYAYKYIRPLVLPDRTVVIDAVDFGVPQFRKRCFFGKFAEPSPTHAESPQLTMDGHTLQSWRTLGEILESPSELFLTPSALDSLTRHKDRLRYIVEFPDPLDRPSRTVLASAHRQTQNTFIVRDRGHYRILTLREHARLQGFPDEFLWFAKYYDGITMIGNAVPPPLARAFAEAIRAREVGKR